MQAREAGQEAARQAVLSEKQKELVSGLQQEHHVQAAAMDQQAKAAIKQVHKHQDPKQFLYEIRYWRMRQLVFRQSKRDVQLQI